MQSKVLALVTLTLLVRKALIPPKPNASIKSETAKNEGILGYLMRNYLKKEGILGYLMIIYLIYAFTSITSLYLYLIFRQGSTNVGNDSPEIDMVSWTMLDVLFFTVLMTGTLLRLYSFRTLDRHFTYTVTIQKNHSLIKTGPYKYVRHPSYTGLFIIFAGAVYHTWRAVQGIPRDWFWGDSKAVFVRSAVFSAVLSVVIFTVCLFRRVIVEEATLKKHFGKEWDSYAAERKRFIPFLA